MTNWNGIVKIEYIEHWSKGKLVSRQENLKNLLHNEGEAKILGIAFATEPRPSFWYLGLDNRSTISVNDTVASISGEPSFGGYNRQAVDNFTIIQENNENFRAVSPIVVFTADSIGSGWGPVQNLFLIDRNDNDLSSYLISTTKLISSIFVDPGDQITLRLQLSMKDCS